MATFTVWQFDTADGADHAPGALERLRKQQLITIHDATIVTWPEDLSDEGESPARDVRRGGLVA